MTGLCVGHHPDNPPAATTGRLCHGHQHRLLEQLRTLPAVATWLHANLAGTGSLLDADRVTGSKEAPVPLRLDVLDLIGPTNGPAAVHDEFRDQTGLPNLLAVIESWVIQVADERARAEPSNDLHTMCSWLAGQVDWIATRDWVGDLLDDLHRLHQAAASVAPWQEQTVRDAEPCPHCERLAQVWHIGDGRVVCERRLGGCGRGRPISENVLTMTLRKDTG